MQHVNIFDALTYDDESVVFVEVSETPCVKEIALAMQAHQVLPDHESLYPLTLHVMEGMVKMTVGEDAAVLIAGDMVSLDAGMKHELEAIDNTLIRLTLFTSCEQH